MKLFVCIVVTVLVCLTSLTMEQRNGASQTGMSPYSWEEFIQMGFEYIKGIVVEPQPFDVERDLVTPTMKKRRAQLLKYYQVEINKLYTNLSR